MEEGSRKICQSEIWKIWVDKKLTWKWIQLLISPKQDVAGYHWCREFLVGRSGQQTVQWVNDPKASHPGVPRMALQGATVHDFPPFSLQIKMKIRPSHFFFHAWSQPQLPVPLNQHCSTTHISKQTVSNTLVSFNTPKLTQDQYPRPTPKTANTPHLLQSISIMNHPKHHPCAVHNVPKVSQHTTFWSTHYGVHSRPHIYLTGSSPYPQVRVPSAGMAELNATAGLAKCPPRTHQWNSNRVICLCV